MKRKELGLTLIEFLISMGILGVVMGTSFYVLTLSNQMSQDSRERWLALNAARSVLEVIKDTAVQNVPAIDTMSFIPAGLPNGTVSLLTNPSPVGTAQIATVAVRVNWTGTKNRMKTLEITTMRSRF